MLPYEQVQERGVPGASTCSSGLAGNSGLFCSERITCLSMQHVESGTYNDLIIMRISFYWGRRELIDPSLCLLTILFLTEVILLAASPCQ